MAIVVFFKHKSFEKISHRQNSVFQCLLIHYIVQPQPNLVFTTTNKRGITNDRNEDVYICCQLAEMVPN